MLRPMTVCGPKDGLTVSRERRAGEWGVAGGGTSEKVAGTSQHVEQDLAVLLRRQGGEASGQVSGVSPLVLLL